MAAVVAVDESVKNAVAAAVAVAAEADNYQLLLW
jgi:hypothetical protein